MNYEIYSYLCGKLQTRIAIISMATTIRETESGIRTSGKNPCHRTTELDKAIEDVKMGRLSGPFSTPEELFEHLKI